MSRILLHVFMKWAARVVWSRSARMMRGPTAQAEHMPLHFPNTQRPPVSGARPSHHQKVEFDNLGASNDVIRSRDGPPDWSIRPRDPGVGASLAFGGAIKLNRAFCSSFNTR